ncbi:curlin repeat-containing protein [Spirosoma fluminis]
MNRLLFVLISIVFGTAQAQKVSQPQSNTLDAYWDIPISGNQRVNTVLVKSQTDIPDPSSPLSSVKLYQEGLNNQAVVQALSGTNNRLDINQVNNGNNVNATLAGANNSLILTQTGGNNIANIGLGGTNNRFMITQDGGDVVNLQGIQKDNLRLELRQGAGANSFNMDNSTLFKDPLSTGIPNLRIEQSGGASITIQQGRVFGN